LSQSPKDFITVSRFFQDFLDRVRKTPSAVAVCHPGASRRATKYAELLKLTEQYAVAFSRVLPPGMFVPIFANKSAEAIACSLACLASGRPFAWLNKRLRGPQLAEIIRAGNTEFIVVDAPAWLFSVTPSSRAPSWQEFAGSV
jgi:acyl-CoA synthetase (AMP-forming)/AMP-acid ligase II